MSDSVKFKFVKVPAPPNVSSSHKCYYRRKFGLPEEIMKYDDADIYKIVGNYIKYRDALSELVDDGVIPLELLIKLKIIGSSF